MDSAQHEAAKCERPQLVVLAVQALQAASRAQIQGAEAVVPHVQVGELLHRLQGLTRHTPQPIQPANQHTHC